MPPTVRRATPERLVLAALAAAAAVMAAGYLSDLIGMRVDVLPWPAAAVAAIWVLRFADLGDDAGSQPGELAVLALVFTFTAGYLVWLASPSLLPVTDGPDVVHHLQLIHFIQRTGRLPHDPALTPYLLEMINYTPGAHIATALVAKLARLDSLRVILPVAICFVAIKSAAVYAIALRVIPNSRAHALAALTAPVLAFAPAAYAVGALFQFFFFAQVISEAFAAGALLSVVGWMRTRRRGYLILFAACGTGVVLAWPVYIAPVAAVLLFAVVRYRAPLLDRTRAVAIALVPVAAFAAIHVARHSEGGGILGASGAVTAPSVGVFGAAFLILAVAGIVIAVVRHEAEPLLVFFAAVLLTAGALAIVGMRSGARGFYLPFKLVYLAVVPAAIFGSVALAAASALPVRFPRVSRAVALFVAALIAVPRLPAVRPRSPITLTALEAGRWARDHVPSGCVDYFSGHWLTGYWLHLDVLGNPRDSDRMRTETFEFRDSVSKWIEGRGLPYAIVEDVSALPNELRPSLTVLASFPPAAVLTRAGSDPNRSLCDGK